MIQIDDNSHFFVPQLRSLASGKRSATLASGQEQRHIFVLIS
jgi:hypothetical protein